MLNKVIEDFQPTLIQLLAKSPDRNWLSGRGWADSKGLLKPDLEAPCGPQPLGGSIAATG